MNDTLLNQFKRNRDEEAFLEIVQGYSGLVFSASLRIVHCPTLAEDVVQETFLRFLNKYASIEKSIAGWLYRVATQISIDKIRSKDARLKREKNYAEYNAIATEGFTWEEIAPHIDVCLSALAPEETELLISHFLKGVTQGELARRKETSQPTISRLLNQSLEKLREELKKKGFALSTSFMLSLLSTNFIEAAPISVIESLGKIALASKLLGSTAVATTTSVTASTWTLPSLKSFAFMLLGLGMILPIATWVVSNSPNDPPQKKEETRESAITNRKFSEIAHNDSIKIVSPEIENISKSQSNVQLKFKFIDAENLLPLKNMPLNYVIFVSSKKISNSKIKANTDENGSLSIELEKFHNSMKLEFSFVDYHAHTVEKLRVDNQNIITLKKPASLKKSNGFIVKLKDQYGELVPHAQMKWSKAGPKRKTKKFQEIKAGTYRCPTSEIGSGRLYIVWRAEDPYERSEHSIDVLPLDQRKEYEVVIKRKPKIELSILNPKEDWPKLIWIRYKSKHSTESFSNIEKYGLEKGYANQIIRLKGMVYEGYLSTKPDSFIYQADGFERSASRIADFEGAVFKDSLYLKKGSHMLSVLVVDKKGEPIQGARVEIGRSYIHDQQTTDYDGKAYFEHLSSNKYLILAGYDSQYVYAMICHIKDTKNTPLKIVLPELLSVEGQVTTNEGKPISSVKFSFIHANNKKSKIVMRGGQMKYENPFTCESNSEGKFELKLPAGFLDVKIISEDYPQLSRRINLQPSEPFLNFELGNSKAILKGRVVDHSGNIQKNFQLASLVKEFEIPSWKYIRTNQKGEFQLELRQNQTVEVFSKQKNWTQTNPIKVKVSHLENVEIKVHQDPKIIFNINSEAGLDIEGLEVYKKMEYTWGNMLRRQKDYDYHLKPIKLQKLDSNRYLAFFQNHRSFLPRLPLQSFAIKTKNHQTYTTEFIDPYSKPNNYEVYISLKSGKALRLKVINENGVALSNVSCWLKTVDGKPTGPRFGIKSNKSGIIDIPNTYDEVLLHIDHQGYQYFFRKFIANSSPIEETIVLKKGFTMNGHVIGINKYKEKIRDLSISGKNGLWKGVDVKENGGFKIPDFAAGKYSLKVLPKNKREYIFVQTFDFIPGQAVEIDLTKLQSLNTSEKKSSEYELEPWLNEGEVDTQSFMTF